MLMLMEDWDYLQLQVAMYINGANVPGVRPDWQVNEKKTWALIPCRKDNPKGYPLTTHPPPAPTLSPPRPAHRYQTTLQPIHPSLCSILGPPTDPSSVPFQYMFYFGSPTHPLLCSMSG
jgi:hypothetical protein